MTSSVSSPSATTIQKRKALHTFTKELRERTKTKSNKKIEEHLLALPNQFPYNEMLFDGKLRLGNYIVKTRSYDPGFRGPTLLYTSGKIAAATAEAHGYNPKEYVRPAIVGVGDLKFVRELNEGELESLLLQFNNATSLNEVYDRDEWIEPLPYGLFFQRLKKFDNPIEFVAEPGPVRAVKVPVDKVADALGKNGIEVVGNKLIYL